MLEPFQRPSEAPSPHHNEQPIPQKRISRVVQIFAGVVLGLSSLIVGRACGVEFMKRWRSNNPTNDGELVVTRQPPHNTLNNPHRDSYNGTHLNL